jgi:hypothetical protein
VFEGGRERVWHRLYARDSFLGGIEKMYGGEIFWTEIFLNFFYGGKKIIAISFVKEIELEI